jgi:hypothetical protein
MNRMQSEEVRCYRLLKSVPELTWIVQSAQQLGYRVQSPGIGVRLTAEAMHNRSEMVAVLGPLEALPYYIQ